MRRRKLLCLTAASIASFESSPAFADTDVSPIDMAPIKTRVPNDVVLIAIARAGDRLVAVGERGVICYSDNNGTIWTQATVPVDLTLTSIAFATPKIGWAAGHYGVILMTADAGQTWILQLNGIQANQLILEAAKAAVADNFPSPGTSGAMKRANIFVAAGPDKPFLSILPFSSTKVIVFGAYRMTMITTDAGKSWQDWSLHIDDPLSHHLYGYAIANSSIYIACETGLVFRSTNNGGTFAMVTSPGDASLFGALAIGDGGVLVYGVAGNCFATHDNGDTWQSIDLGTAANITCGRALDSGMLLLASEAGDLYASSDHAASFKKIRDILPLAPADLVQAANGDIFVVGNQGMAIVPLAIITQT